MVNDGAVKAFREVLWSEHTGGESCRDPDLGDPGSLATMRRIRHLADEALAKFAHGNGKPHHVRFMTYPLVVRPSGEVVSNPDVPHIPGTRVPVKGRPHHKLVDPKIIR